jgi:hypothetical protein
VHLSFLEYLCAYRIAEDKSKSQADHIAALLEYLEYPAWEEPILLALYLFDRSTGPSFIDAFSAAVLDKLIGASAVNGWLLLGRAVRDNLRLAHEDLRRIIGGILNLWLKGCQEDLAFSILEEMVRFSNEGKNILKSIIMEAVKNKPAEEAFDCVFLYEKLYAIDLPLLEAVAGPLNLKESKGYIISYWEKLFKAYCANLPDPI